MPISLPKNSAQNSAAASTRAWQMTHEYRAFADARTQIPGSASVAFCSALVKAAAVRRTIPALLFVILLFGAGTMRAAFADGLSRATAAYSRGDYVRAANELSPLALRGNARAQTLLGFMYENGFGVPQAYDAATDLYQRAAVQGDPSAQSRLGASATIISGFATRWLRKCRPIRSLKASGLLCSGHQDAGDRHCASDLTRMTR